MRIEILRIFCITQRLCMQMKAHVQVYCYCYQTGFDCGLPEIMRKRFTRVRKETVLIKVM